MFVFGIVRSSTVNYRKFAEPGLERVSDPLSAVIVKDGASSIAVAYNEILEEAGRLYPDAEAVVLLHQDLEIRDEAFSEKVRAKLGDPSIGLIGVIGAQDIRSIVYWRATVRGYVNEESRTLDFGRGFHEVDAIDGMLMIIAPSVARSARFDQALALGFHGYDIDFSSQVRARGLRVVVDAIDVIHHTAGGYGDRRAYLTASRAWRRKWLNDAPLSVLATSWLDEFYVAIRRDQYNLRSLLHTVRQIPSLRTRRS